MKKTLHIILISMFVYVLFSFTSIYAETTIPMIAVTYRLDSYGHYKSLPGVTYTSDDDSIDFTYITTVNGLEKTYTAAFIKNGNIFSYTYTGDKTGIDAYYQALLNNIATNAIFYAIGNANGLEDSTLADMAKDFSKYTYYTHGLEIKTYNYTGTIDGTTVNISAIQNFKMNAKSLSITGNANLKPIENENIENEKTDVEIVEKENPIKTIIVYTIITIVILLIIVLVSKVKHRKNIKRK